MKPQSSESKRFVEREVRDYERNGLHLEASVRKSIEDAKQRVSTLQIGKQTRSLCIKRKIMMILTIITNRFSKAFNGRKYNLDFFARRIKRFASRFHRRIKEGCYYG